MRFLRSLNAGVILISLALPLAQSHAATSGASCPKAGATQTTGGKKLTCVKSGKRLIWKIGFTGSVPIGESVAPITPMPTVPAKPKHTFTMGAKFSVLDLRKSGTGISFEGNDSTCTGSLTKLNNDGNWIFQKSTTEWVSATTGKIIPEYLNVGEYRITFCLIDAVTKDFNLDPGIPTIKIIEEVQEPPPSFPGSFSYKIFFKSEKSDRCSTSIIHLDGSEGIAYTSFTSSTDEWLTIVHSPHNDQLSFKISCYLGGNLLLSRTLGARFEPIEKDLIDNYLDGTKEKTVRVFDEIIRTSDQPCIAQIYEWYGDKRPIQISHASVTKLSSYDFASGLFSFTPTASNKYAFRLECGDANSSHSSLLESDYLHYNVIFFVRVKIVDLPKTASSSTILTFIALASDNCSAEIRDNHGHLSRPSIKEIASGRYDVTFVGSIGVNEIDINCSRSGSINSSFQLN